MDESKSNEATGNKHGGSRNNMLKLLDLVQELSGEPGNQWFSEEIGKRFKLESKGNSNIQIVEVYEEYSRRKFLSRASKFYDGFPMPLIKDELIADYIRMEEFRQKDHLEDFCLAAFQQLENIIITLLKKGDAIQYYKNNITSPAVLKYNMDKAALERKAGDLYSLGKLIFMKKTADIVDYNVLCPMEIKDWKIKEILRLIIYYYYFKTEVKYNTDNFHALYSTAYSIYQLRNKNHRGSEETPTQAEIIFNANENKEAFYFKTLGFLSDFILTIKQNINYNKTNQNESL